VTEREAKVDHIQRECEKTKGQVRVQVGSVVYHTTANTLLKIKDSFFHGLLNPDFQSDKETLFIDRDGEVFQYILEYLTYDKLVSDIDNERHFQKLLIDADYYLLPDLVKQLNVIKEERKNQQQQQKDKILLKLRSTATATNGADINWNVATMVPDSHFRHNGSTTITVKQAGLYQIFVQYVCQCSTHGNGSANIDLYVSGSVVARVYQGQNDGHQQSRSLMEILFLQPNSTITVRYFSNSDGVADQLANSITILLL